MNGGGFFTGYWLTTGDPITRNTAGFGIDPLGETGSLSNAIVVGVWYTNTDNSSMTSGTSGVYVPPVPEPAGATLLAIAVNGLLVRRRHPC